MYFLDIVLCIHLASLAYTCLGCLNIPFCFGDLGLVLDICIWNKSVYNYLIFSSSLSLLSTIVKPQVQSSPKNMADTKIAWATMRPTHHHHPHPNIF